MATGNGITQILLERMTNLEEQSVELRESLARLAAVVEAIREDVSYLKEAREKERNGVSRVRIHNVRIEEQIQRVMDYFERWEQQTAKKVETLEIRLDTLEQHALVNRNLIRVAFLTMVVLFLAGSALAQSGALGALLKILAGFFL